MSGNDVFLVDGLRSPIGRGHPEKGIYRDLRADELAVQTLGALLARTGLEEPAIDDFYLGCVGQHLEQGKNLARLVLLLAGLPTTIPGVTVNRLCASSLTALQMAADSIRAGTNELVLVGGVEHMGHVPMTASTAYHEDLFRGAEFRWTNMGLTAEKLAGERGVGREEQDAFALESNRRYFEAKRSGFFAREIVPIRLPGGKTVVDDEEPRLSDLATLAALHTPFLEGGTVTAATSSGVSDGACMAVLSGFEGLGRFARPPLARVLGTANVGLEPSLMGLGPVLAIRKLLSRAGMSIGDIDLFEINEAFAVVILACQEELGIDPGRVNVHGGGVAIGHPLGASGLRLAVTLAHALAAKGLRRGIASLCVGHGQGVAMMIETLED
ncbi:MAG: thiolase family protein [Candidatus Eisenbacteria bacterium]